MCVYDMSFSKFLLNKIKVPKFINNAHWKDPRPLHQQMSWMKAWSPNMSPGSFYFFALASKREGALEMRLQLNWTNWRGLNCLKERWDNAHVQINSVLFLHIVLTLEVSVLFIRYMRMFLSATFPITLVFDIPQISLHENNTLRLD